MTTKPSLAVVMASCITFSLEPSGSCVGIVMFKSNSWSRTTSLYFEMKRAKDSLRSDPLILSGTSPLDMLSG